MPACLRYKSAVTGSRQTGRLYQSFAWRGPWEKAPERLPTVRSAPLHEGKRRRRKKAIPTLPLGPPTLGPGLWTRSSPCSSARPGPKKEKLAEICRHLVEAHHQEAAIYPHFRRPTPGGWRRSCLDQVLVELSHLIPGFILFIFLQAERENSLPARIPGAAAHTPSRLFPGSRRK